MIHSENEANAIAPVQLAADDGVFELAGSPPTWISVFTCPTPRCQCRTALVLGTDSGRETLLERAASVRNAWNSNADYGMQAEQLDDLVAFYIDIDTTAVFSLASDTPIEIGEHPRIAEVVNRIDGDLLDSIGSHWYRGKGLPDPVQDLRDGNAAMPIPWQRGQMVPWNDVCDVRQDLYVLDDRRYEAIEAYCPVPACDCGEVIVAFSQPDRLGVPSVGHVVVQRSGTTEIIPARKGSDRVQRLWSAFRQRHPNHLARFGRRYPSIKAVGERRLNLPISAVPKIGRNAACPCGSGKKYKRCCGAS